ncbi:MAG TPA: 50S ribosomal protein L11 methyltransferase [Syntrophorhabdaceae bacterium]|nr:50S ribosomal protein L11 methyltransferase [Syntrophorhabdaceae bacterium]HPU29206.1 50S ribosomal protein L11 methyltransferase [Syntrophorhabdaceae bacterium]
MKDLEEQKYIQVEVHLEKGAEELLPEGIYDSAKKGLWIEENKDSSIIRCFPDNMEEFFKILRNTGLKIKDVEIKEVAFPDYSELTMKYFKPISVYGVKIIPPWSKKMPQGSIIIHPGMAFGTGRHESTKLMIKLMQKIDFKGKHVIDIGCGSGILAIFARMRGAKSVVAVDNDLDAVLSAKKNTMLNKLNKISIVCADIKDIKGSFDVVLANLDIRTFQKNGKKIEGYLKTNSLLIISGILKKEKKNIFEVFKDLQCIVEEHKNSWEGMILKPVS